MTFGGRKVDAGGGGICPSTNSCAMSDRVNFVPVKSNTIDLVNILHGGLLVVVGVLDDEVQCVI